MYVKIECIFYAILVSATQWLVLVAVSVSLLSYNVLNKFPIKFPI